MNSKDSIAVALQRAGCGFGTYSANELVAASSLDAAMPAEQVMADARLRHKLLGTLFETARQQIAAVEELGLYYNPADVLWGPISRFRSSLLVYRKAGSLQYSPTAEGTVWRRYPSLFVLPFLAPETFWRRKNSRSGPPGSWLERARGA